MTDRHTITPTHQYTWGIGRFFENESILKVIQDLKGMPSLICAIVFSILISSCSDNPHTLYQEVQVDYTDYISTPEEADSIRNLIVEKQLFSERNIRLLSQYYIGTRKFDELLTVLKPLFSYGVQKKCPQLVLYSGAYLASIYIELDKRDSMIHYLNPTLRIDSIYPGLDKHYSGMIHNLAAIYNIRNDLDYTTALYHYQIAKDATESNRDSLNLSIVLANIGKIFSIRQDSSGFNYIKTALNLSRNVDNTYLKTRLLILLGEQYLLRDIPDSAIYCIELIDTQSISNKNNLLLYHLLAAKTLKKLEKQEEAEKHFAAAIANISERPDMNGYDIPTYIAYGDLKKDMGKYEESVNLYRKGLEIADKNSNREHNYDIYLKMSDTYERMGLADSALAYSKQYIHAYTKAFTDNKEKEFYELKRKYDELNHQKQLQKTELQSLLFKRKYEQIIYVAVILSIVTALSLILYKKERTMRSRLLNQYLAFKHTIEKEQTAKRKEGGDSELFYRIEELMQLKKLYRKSDLSLEKVAEFLSVSSAAISKAINEFSRATFPQYICKYRIQEAVEILSDTHRNEPVKSVAIIVGYTTFSTFYRAFLKETGLSPSAFRTEIMKKSHDLSEFGNLSSTDCKTIQ